MTTKEILAMVGRTGTYNVRSASFQVEIADAKSAYGRTDVLIRPVAGSGEIWVSTDAVQLDPAEPKAKGRLQRG